MTRIIIASRAKINIGLSLLGQREDGYTEIATVFQAIDLADSLAVSVRPASSDRVILQCSGIPVPQGEDNLILQAVSIARTRMGFHRGLDIALDKRIPLGGGLGGGSSNAAATLLALRDLFLPDLDTGTLQRWGAEIGSDVPFFLGKGTALGLGRGERLTPLHWAMEYWILLVFPGLSVSTRWAYTEAKIALTKPEKKRTFKALFSEFSGDQCINELEDVVFARYPELGAIKAQLLESGAFYASMSGSGSTLFGLFQSRAAAEKARLFFSSQGRDTVISKPEEAPLLRRVG